MVQQAIRVYLAALLMSCITSAALAKPLVTGWHQILVSGSHAGYLVQEYKYDKSSKEFTATNFVHITLPGSRIDRSLQAKATEKLKPIEYHYTEKTNNAVKLIDAEFKNNIMNLSVTQNGNVQQKQVQMKDGTFLGIFLYILMITNKTGIKVGNNFGYYAVAEDTGQIHAGKADVTEISKLEGLDVLRVLNKFAGEQTVEFVTPTGQIVRILDPKNSLEIRLVKGKAEAVGSFPVSPQSLKLLFGAEPKDSFPAPIAKILPSKKQGGLPKGVPAPPGKGF